MTKAREGPPPADSVERRVRAELRQMGLKASSVGAMASLGVVAIDLAKTMDRTRAARDKAALSRELRMVLEQVRAVAAPPKGDEVDEVAEQRARRRSGAAAAGAAGVDDQG